MSLPGSPTNKSISTTTLMLLTLMSVAISNCADRTVAEGVTESRDEETAGSVESPGSPYVPPPPKQMRKHVLSGWAGIGSGRYSALRGRPVHVGGVGDGL